MTLDRSVLAFAGFCPAAVAFRKLGITPGAAF